MDSISEITMETTAIQKLESLLLVSVPRDLTDNDVLQLRRQVLQQVRRHHSRWVLLDFSRVDICDSFFLYLNSSISVLKLLRNSLNPSWSSIMLIERPPWVLQNPLTSLCQS